MLANPTHQHTRGQGTIANTAFVQPSAFVSGDSSVDEWSYVGLGAVLDSATTVATRAFVDDGANIIHGAIGSQSVIGKGAILRSGVVVGTDSIVGAGSLIASGVTIGDRVIICPGARVTANVPDDTTVTSDCCGGNSVIIPKFNQLFSINYEFDGSWNNFSVDMFAAAATADWTAAGEPAVPLDIAYARPFLGADDMSCDRLVLSGYFGRNGLTHVVNGLTFTLKKQSGVIATASINSDFAGSANSIIDTSGTNILAVGDGLALIANMNGGASPQSSLNMNLLVTGYHKNY